ncbi:3-hydroxybutyryl-CoA dehydrogenase [Actinophytocola xinjiangensis]|uniref:3-hydroxybutyryl-CoA dehydrogenase n=1 Tax=Actinophytocola xinjiangensis TaxID=485602 RepID=A0A7Z0WLE4_9PSEU|nr:3-hydroxyacyl-CoA dehydrogenase family protein [Actinophytocola xinjiangensis]OLF10157.1 3-hydroxybutyryl-CoA dehydrogenase [Actinophytocola xinjiangensis]
MATVGVIGAGVMGKDVAITCAANGYDVVLVDHDSDVTSAVPGQIRGLVRKFRMMSPDASDWKTDDILGAVRATTDLAEVAKADWVVENIVEDHAAKERLYLELRPLLSDATRVAVNTSCISITKLGALLADPGQVIGIHFMNPVPLLGAAEVVRGFHTSDDTVAQARDFVGTLGKKAIVVNDMPGFVANRLSHLFMNEAAFLVGDGVAEPEQIDAVFKLGYGHKMGPLETADLIGLDTVVNSLNVLHEEFQDPKFRCSPTLKKMVAAGLLGRKSGQGFYSYGH